MTAPPFAEWGAFARRNASLAEEWPAALRDLRLAAREESVSLARGFTRAIGAPVPAGGAGSLIVMTGHQPEIYHPGVWVKALLVQRLSEEISALGMDVVVDTDVPARVELLTPRLAPQVTVGRALLAEGTGAVYAQMPVPDAERRATFRRDGLEALATLPAPSLRRHFARFCDCLEAAVGSAHNLGELLVAARRRYEAPALTDYLEIPVSAQSKTKAFARFAGLLLTDPERFREVSNAALARYRQRTGTRSLAQPFPDLGGAGERVEVPFWLLRDGARVPLHVDARRALLDGERVVAELGQDADSATAALLEARVALVPRAMTLTMFERVFVSDLFVHGTGGGRYDRVTDEVVREFLGIEPPAFVVASMTLLLPLGCRITTEADVADLEQRVHRLEHNPDQVLGEVEFDTVLERERAEALAARKAELVAAIARPEADRKLLGAAIREVNEELTVILADLVTEMRAELARLRSARDESAVLTDRTYPYCLWDPCEVMDKVR